MKKLFLLSLLLCLAMVQAAAATWTDANGVTWTFETYQYSYNYGGSSHYYYSITGASNYGDNVTVPSTVYVGETPYTIEAIEGVFYNNKTLTTVTLPATLKVIGSNAFRGCSALTSVGDISHVEYIRNYAFKECTSLSSVDLSGCQVILWNAFDRCTSLTDIGSLAACSIIDTGAFCYCTNLQSVDLKVGVTLGLEAFSDCTNLSSVSSLKDASIDNGAFRYCTSLTSVDLSQAKSLGDYAFYGCQNLQSVGDLSAHMSISNYVFYGCYNLESVDLSNCTYIGNAAFYNCLKLQNVNTSKCTNIGNEAFSSCQNLQSVDLSKIQAIGTSAFSNCTSLETVGDLSNFTSIPNNLFYGCSKLQNVSLPNVTTVGNSSFSSCTALTAVNLPKATIIDDYAFSNCKNVETLSLPLVQTIGNGAFYGCSSLDAPTITSTALNSIGGSAFNTPGTITLMVTTPPVLTGPRPGYINDYAFGSLIVVRVPDAALATYRAADKWSDFKSRIVGIGSQIDYDVNVTAAADKSALHVAIGEENLGSVVSLKVAGTINSYDIMVLRNKMDNLHYLDLTDASIVANGYEYITGYHSDDDVLGAMSFNNLSKLVSVKLPKSINRVGSSAFQGCSNLKEVEFQTGLNSIGSGAFNNCSNLKAVVFPVGLETIESSAFSGCGNLKTIEMKAGLKTIGNYAFGYDNNFSGQPQEEELILPEGLTSVGQYAFGYNTNLKRVAFPSTLKTIGSGAFKYCNNLQSISLPTSLESIPYNAFNGCRSLTEARIPSTIQSIGSNAFGNCPALNDVYTYIVEPTPINMETFSTYTTATLHVPSTSYYNYWYDTEWSQFRSLVEFEAVYEYFYINNDFTISDDYGTISGEIDGDDPDADLNPGSGLIVETDENNPQELDELHIKAKGSDVASVITASNLEANKVYFDIEIQAGRWYFLSFPFNVKTANVTAPGAYTFRIYDPEERANGKVGWKNWIGDLLYKGQGYIFHCAKSGMLSLCVEKEDINWDAEDRPQALASAPAANAQDASWNFIGNPQTSYVDIDETGYDQPITVWNGTGYEAVRPGDDSYALQPFEAFFVQKPDNKSEIEFPADGRYTQTQWNEAQQAKAASRRMKGVDVDRQIVNLVLTNGQNEDKTRVVFNEQKSKDYELDCDAAKFLSSENVPQLYTLDQRQGRYAINERPMGEVKLGYVATANGELTIKATRMDQPMMLRDTKLQITHDLSMGDYTFSAEAGTDESRFILTVDNSATSVGQLRQQTGVSVMAEKGGIFFSGIDDQVVNVYALNGTLLAGNASNGQIALPKATYLVKVGTTTAKVIVR